MIPSENVIYQKRAWTILSRSMKLGRAAGTYLLYGPEGTGRWLLAVSYAALLNCEKPQNVAGDSEVMVPCGECRNCRNIFSLSFEGLHLAVPIPPHNNKLDDAIDLTNEVIQQKREEPFRILSSSASTNIPVAMAREIRRRLSLKATTGVKRVVIFYQMERMKTASADALLKLIEEPPADTTIMLIAANPDTLLPTIQSRAQKIKVDTSPTKVIEDYLRQRYELGEQRVKLLARVSEGSIGRAVAAATDSEEDETSLRTLAFLLFKSLFLESGADTLSHMNEMLNLRDRGEAEELLRVWQAIIRDCSTLAVMGDSEVVVNVDFRSDLEKLCGRFSVGSLAAGMAGDIKNTLADLRLNVHIQGSLMALALKLRGRIAAAK